MARVFAVASAKGGVGKTTTTANLGVILAETGADVVVIDGDIGMANLGAALGIESPPTTLHDVLSGTAKTSEATYEGPGGVYVVPGDTALSSYASADPETLPSVLRTHSQADYVLIDVGAGVSHETSLPLSLADEVLLVSTPERDALRDTEKTRQLTEQLGGTVAGAVITRTDPSTPVSELATGTLAATVLASIPEDEAVRDSLAVGEPLLTYAPNSPAAAAYRELVAELTGIEPEAPPESESAATAPDSPADADSLDAEPADTAATADTSTGATADVDAHPEPTASDADQTDTDAESDERQVPKAESKWAEAATGTGIDVDEQLADEAAAISEADDESAAPPAADESETDQTAADAADGTAAADDGDDTESAATDAETDDGVTPEPTTETITESAADASSPVAEVASGITPDPSADDDADLVDDAEPTPEPDTGDAADPAEEAIPFRDEDTGDDASDETPESTGDEPTAGVSDEPTDGDDSEIDEPLIPDAEGESSPTPDEPSAMTTELGAATGEAADDTDESDDDDDEKKGFFRRLFFG